MPGKIKLHWVTKAHNIPGNALGYNQHNVSMRRFSELYFDYTEEADIALTIAPADFFVPVPGKLNILFSMFEFLDLPNSYIQRICRADALIVPSRFCKELFRRYYDGPIYVCQEGIDPQVFPYYERSVPFGRFRFLWVGAANPRKGWPVIMHVINAISDKWPNVEIYLKTTTQKANRRNYVTKLWQNRRRLRSGNPELFKEMLGRTKNPDVSNQLRVEGRHRNVVFDSRKLSFEDLMSLYHSSHAFIFPTFGEGWGLTLCEAMATGLPCIATPVTGCADYFDESVGYCIDYDIKEQQLSNYDLITKGFVPRPQSLLDQMIRVMSDYPKALRKGRRASDRIHGKFTWERAAARLRDIIDDIAYGQKNKISCSGVFAMEQNAQSV